MQLSTPSRLALAAALVLASPLAAQKAQKVPAIDEATATATANAALEAAPVFDGHNDVPNQLRARVANQINAFDFEDTTHTGEAHPQGAVMQTDLARLRQGKVGAQFWSVYVPSNPDEAEAVQEVIEQIDVTKRLIARNPDGLRFVTNADQVERAGLRSEDGRPVQPPHAERTESARVTDGDEPIRSRKEHRECAFIPRQRLGDRRDDVAAL